MCGIAGIIHIDGSLAQRQVIEKMTSSLAHRGPDGFGIEARGPVAFGHRRLSIIDLAGGAQPMCNEDGQVWITFNGEVYNYLTLRSELQSKGHQFKTNSDTETIIHAYEEWGVRCVERFRGMFAFGIVDFRAGNVFLARDHFGMKPLYYIHQNNTIAFASELQAIKQIPGIRLTYDLQAFDQFLWLQYIPAPATAFKEIKKLEPAHYISFSLDGHTAGAQKFWDVDFSPNYSRTEHEWIEALDEVLHESIQAHLVADVPFGAFLSGGVDSSLVVAHMSQILDRPVKAFSIGFEEEEFNETYFARYAAHKYEVEHYVEIVKPDALEMLPKLVQHYGDLFGDSSAIPTYYVSKLARTHVPMVLSGDGADESFAGYWSHGGWLTALLRNNSAEANLAYWLSFINYIETPVRTHLWRPECKVLCPDPLDEFVTFWEKTRTYSPCHKVQYMDLKTYLPYAILTKVDIASMMNGLEVRPPFVDVKVAEFAATIPEHFNIGWDRNGELIRKKLLKSVAGRYFPPEFLHRPKMGFGVPIAKWFAPGGQLNEYLHERLLGSSSTLHEYFNPQTISQVITQEVPGPKWLLLYAEEWLRQNKTDFIPCDMQPDQIDIRSGELHEPAPDTLSPPIVLESNQPLKVLIVYDVEGWAWWHKAKNIQKNAPADITVVLLNVGQPYDHKEYDQILYFDPQFIGHAYSVPPEKLIIGCSCPKFLDQFVDLVSMARCSGGFVNNTSMYYSSSYQVPNIFCCQNGVDEKLFTPPVHPVKEFKACWVGNASSVGNKGLELISAACEMRGIELLTIDREASKDSQSLLTQEQLRDRLYHKASFYICASESEGTPNPALEALSCGLPVISTKVGNMPEIIIDGYNGFLVERTAAAIAEAIQKLSLLDMRILSENARRSIIEGWTWAQKSENYFQMFRAIRAHASPWIKINSYLAGAKHFLNTGNIKAALEMTEKALAIDHNNNYAKSTKLMLDKLIAINDKATVYINK